MLMVAEQGFRRLGAPESLELVYLGIDLHGIQEASDKRRYLPSPNPFYTLFNRTSLSLQW